MGVFALMEQPQSTAGGLKGRAQLKGNVHRGPYFILMGTMMVWARVGVGGQLQEASKIYYAQCNS